MEESLTLDELIHLSNGIQKAQYESHKFAAALKGISLDEHSDGGMEDASGFDAVKRRVDEKIGANKESQEFQDLGFGFEEEEEIND